MSKPTPEDLWRVLGHFHKPVTAKVLATYLSVPSDSAVRELVHTARTQGYLIGSDSRGYYRCKTAREVRRTIDRLENRASHIWTAAHGMSTSHLEVHVDG